jgi:TetR/AcrR family transcriptional regulator, tetracycline repressor protein
MVLSRPGEVFVHDATAREALLAAKRGRLKSLSPDTHPHLTETADFFLTVPDEEAFYARGLDFVLAFTTHEPQS